MPWHELFFLLTPVFFGLLVLSGDRWFARSGRLNAPHSGRRLVASNPEGPLSRWSSYGHSFLSVCICTALCFPLDGRVDQANLVMVYLLGIIALSYRKGAGPAVLATFLSLLAFDFFFVPPRFTLAVAETRFLFMFLVMLLVGLLISHLAVRVRRQTEKNQQAQMQVETERLRSSLLSSVSHDLRTPLAAITGSISSLLQNGESLPGPAQRDLLENIYDESQRMERLVNNLLEMTKLESGTLRPNLELNHPGEVIGSAIARLEKKLGGRSLATHIPEDLPLVPMDGLLIEQVVVNLLDNALKYTPSSSPVEITAGISEGRLRVEVADRGPGLPEAGLPHLFDKFYRGPQHDRTSGAGLGLSICKGFVEVHGGTIEAKNRPGGGALFAFTLPLEAPHAG